METEIRQNIEGKFNLTLKDEVILKDNYIGSRLENFDMLKILVESEDDTGKCLSLKIQSKINNKLYFMKKYENKLSLAERENFLNILKNCKHPNIIKNVKIIFQDNSYFLIDEYMNNGDLQDYMKVYESLNKPIKEDTLWNIFFQCASSLKYLHEKDFIHRYIRLDNFLMNENKEVKLGNFRKATICKGENKITGKINKTILFQSPEMINNLEYGKKADIFSLGVVFYKLCFYDYPYSLKKKDGQFVFEPKEKKNNLNYYSNEIINIINLMIKIDEKDRPDANNLYDMILKEYAKRIKTNSSIEAVFRCFNSFKNFSSYMLENKNSFQNEKQYPVSFNIIKCFEDFNINKEKQNCSLYINNFRTILYNNGQIGTNKEEINPILILDYLLEKLHRETGGNSNKNTFGIQHAEFKEDKMMALEESKNYYLRNYNSFIFKNFAGFLKTKRICQKKEENKCKYYSFNIFPYIEFNIDNCMEENEILNKYNYQPEIKEWFNLQNNHGKFLSVEHNILCPKCNNIEDHYEFKQFYELSNNLIIAINRGDKYRNKSNVIYSQKLEIKAEILNYNFKLVGLIKRMMDNKGEYFACLYLDKDTNEWMLYKRNEIKKVNSPFFLSEGVAVMLFYTKI